MSATYGFLGGVLALTALDAVVSSKGATNNVSGLLGTAASIIRHLSDPTVPAIPDRSTGTSTSSAPLPAAPAPSTTTAGYGSTSINTKTGSTSALFT